MESTVRLYVINAKHCMESAKCCMESTAGLYVSGQMATLLAFSQNSIYQH